MRKAIIRRGNEQQILNPSETARLKYNFHCIVMFVWLIGISGIPDVYLLHGSRRNIQSIIE